MCNDQSAIPYGHRLISADQGNPVYHCKGAPVLVSDSLLLKCGYKLSWKSAVLLQAFQWSTSKWHVLVTQGTSSKGFLWCTHLRPGFHDHLSFLVAVASSHSCTEVSLSVLDTFGMGLGKWKVREETGHRDRERILDRYEY